MSLEDSFLKQINSVRIYLRKKVASLKQVLQEREIALLSELQQLEIRYGEGISEQNSQLSITKERILELSLMRERVLSTFQRNYNQEILKRQHIAQLDAHMRELQTNLEAARERMRQVGWKCGGNLEEITSIIRSIRVSGVPDYKERVNTVMLTDEHVKTREQAATKAKV